MRSLTLEKVKLLGSILLIVCFSFLMGCSDEDPVKQDVPEFISSVKLIFTPVTGAVVTATASDPDGIGPGDITVSGPIKLIKNVPYKLSFEILNNLAAPTDPEYNVSDEIEEEGDEHQFFFAWTNSIFSNPIGNGNIDNPSDPLNYADEDVNGLPIGLLTNWTVTDIATTGTFTLLLKHQPDLKSNTSTSNDGETDLDLTFDVTVE